MEIKDSQYQNGIKLMSGVGDAVQHSISALKKREERSTIRRRIEEVEFLVKKVKRELGF